MELKDLIERWGSALSEALLESPSQVFQVPGLKGVIGYTLKGTYAVTFGDPICPTEEREPLAEAFLQFCEKKGWSVIYIGASEPFARWAVREGCPVMMEIGEEIVLDPRKDYLTGADHQRMRNDLHHAENLGLHLFEYKGGDPELEKAMVRVSREWLKARKGPQIYLTELHLFKDRNNKRWFYTQKEGEILSVALISKISEGWLLKYMMRLPHSLRGTSEITLLSLLELLQKEGCPFLTFGIIPIAQLGEAVGLGKLATSLAKMGYKMARAFFHFDKRKEFWRKFRPETRRAFIIVSKKVGVGTIRALFKSLKID